MLAMSQTTRCTNAMSDFQFESVIQSGKVSYLQVVSGYTTVRGIGKKLGPNLNFLSMRWKMYFLIFHPIQVVMRMEVAVSDSLQLTSIGFTFIFGLKLGH